MTTIVILGAASAVLVCTAFAQTVNFDSFPTGSPPPGWTATKTGTGNPKWTIERDDSAPILAVVNTVDARACAKSPAR